jgi:hypothetical protein
MTCWNVFKIPFQFRTFFQRLVLIFGWKFVGIVMVVYGLNQGIGEGWMLLNEIIRL